MIRSEVPGWALGCHSFVQRFFSIGRDGRSRADGVFSLCRGKPEATKEHPDLFGYMGTSSDLAASYLHGTAWGEGVRSRWDGV